MPPASSAYVEPAGTDHLTLDLHLAHARTNLLGNGSQACIAGPGAGRDSVFTAPDQTNNDFDGVHGAGELARRQDLVEDCRYAVLPLECDTRSYNGDGTSLRGLR
ncbi:MAG: hypothetical protein U1F35_10590 [Steroidobacteraceae bacterium]